MSDHILTTVLSLLREMQDRQVRIEQKVDDIADHVDEVDRNALRPYGDGQRTTRRRWRGR